MNVFHIKLVAVASMTISHVGYFFFPQSLTMQLIGVGAFPLFAWLIANGARHTSDLRGYLVRLGIFALISQVPFALANGFPETVFGYLNVFFSLFFGLLAIAAIQKGRMLGFFAVVGLSILAQLLNTDYGAAGVLSVVAFHLFFDRIWLMAAAQAVILGLMPFLTYLFEWQTGFPYSIFYMSYPFELVALYAFAFIALYNGERGYPAKYLFYAFYPTHFLAIYFVQQLLA